MQSLVKKGLFLCLLVIGCCFMMSGISYAKIHPESEAETTCEMSTPKSGDHKDDHAHKHGHSRKHRHKKDKKSSKKRVELKKQVADSMREFTEERCDVSIIAEERHDASNVAAEQSDVSGVLLESIQPMVNIGGVNISSDALSNTSDSADQDDRQVGESAAKKEKHVKRKKKAEDDSHLKSKRPDPLTLSRFIVENVEPLDDPSTAIEALRSPKYVNRTLEGDCENNTTTTTTTTKVGHKRSPSKVEKSTTKDFGAPNSRRSSALFSVAQVNIPENILRDTDGVIENPVSRQSVKLRVSAPTLISTTPGSFGIKVLIDNELKTEIDNVSVYVRFEDDSPELSFAPPVPVVKDIKLVDVDQYLYNVQVSRVKENVSRSFLVYVTHKAKDKLGEEREYLLASHKQQFFLNQSPPNKAIIIVPGICGSELFSSKAQVINGVQYSRGYRVWPPEGVATVMEDGLPCCTSARAKSKFVQRLWQDVTLISCTDDGESKASIMRSNPIMDCKNNPDRRNFGTINCYSGLVEGVLKSNYAQDAKVIFFSYDWRIGNKRAADSLKKFIAKNDLTDVVLVAHSMGGLVCASLLADSRNCQNISKVIFLGAPFLGAAKAYNVLENGMFFDGIIGDVTAPIANPAISLLAKNWKSVYEMLPPQQLFDIMRGPSCRSDRLDRGYLYTRRSKSNPLTSNYVLRDYDESLAIIRSRNWTPNVDTFVSDAQKFHNSLYTRDGEIRFMRNRVPVYNVVGINVDTHAGYFLTYGRKNKVSCKEDQDDGDGTVSLLSSTLFGNIPDRNTYYVKGINHMGLMQHAKCLQLINNIIDGHDERFDPTMIVKSYPSSMEKDSCCACCFPPCLC